MGDERGTEIMITVNAQNEEPGRINLLITQKKNEQTKKHGKDGGNGKLNSRHTLKKQ